AVAAEVMLQCLIVGDDLAKNKKIVFADAPGVLANRVAKDRRRTRFHMLDRIETKAVDVGSSDPILVDLDQPVQYVGAPDIELFQAQKIAVDRLLGIAPVADLTAPFVTLRPLQLDRPNRVVFLQVRCCLVFAPETEIEGSV